MALPPDFAQNVKSMADIVRIVGETVTLKRSGNSHVGLCPFHQEKTPSFSVHATRQFYYCFGCGAKGDVFRFVMETEKVAFPEAVRRVAQRMGIPVPVETRPDEAASPEAKLRKALEDVHQKALAFFRKQLQSPEAAPVRELIAKRGVTPESAEEFGLGYAPAGGDALARFLSKEGFASNVLEASGLVLRRDSGGYIDRFRGRWIFPIANETGRPIAFAGRALGADQPKYMNSPETPLYTKSRILYNLSRAREAIRNANTTLLVEGYMDAIAAWQAGARNVVASCGTSLTEPQVHLLSRHAPEVIVSYDPDSAGVTATDRSLALLLSSGMQVRILRLPGSLDPDQYIRQSGPEAYRARIAEAQPVFRYLAGRALELHQATTPEAKLAALNFVLPYVASVPNQLIRSELAADIVQKLDVNASVVREAFQKAAVERRRKVEAPSATSSVPTAEAMLIRLLLDNGDSQQKIAKLLNDRGLLDMLEARTLVSTLLGMLAAGEPADVTSLADRLNGDEQRVLAEIVFDKGGKPVSIEEIETYITALERKRLQQQRLALQRKIQDAHKAQDSRLALDLLRKQSELDRALANLL
jgi:DNA primase